jgi:hypothetical protein
LLQLCHVSPVILEQNEALHTSLHKQQPLHEFIYWFTEIAERYSWYTHKGTGRKETARLTVNSPT